MPGALSSKFGIIWKLHCSVVSPSQADSNKTQAQQKKMLQIVIEPRAVFLRHKSNIH
jgi:hypothetical protein